MIGFSGFCADKTLGELHLIGRNFNKEKSKKIYKVSEMECVSKVQVTDMIFKC